MIHSMLRDEKKEQLIDELTELQQQIADSELERKTRIGEILVEIGYLTESQLGRSLEKQKAETNNQILERRRRKIGEILIESGTITEEGLHRALAKQQVRLRYNVPGSGHGSKNEPDVMRDRAKEQLVAELTDLRREIAELKASEAERKQAEKRRAVRIGEILMEMGCLTRLQLVRYLEEQKAYMHAYALEHRQKRLGEILLESGVVTEEELYNALAEQRGRLRHWHRSE